MAKIVIDLRDDLDGVKIDNSEIIERITNTANKYYSCESVSVEESKD